MSELRSFYLSHSRVVTDTGDELITKQAHKAECDINNILKQYQRTGIINHIQSARPTYTDLPDQLDYQISLDTIREAENAFASLPARVRAHFSNSPEEFLAAFGDPAQRDYLTQNGFLKAPEASPAVPATTPPANDQSAA